MKSISVMILMLLMVCFTQAQTAAAKLNVAVSALDGRGLAEGEAQTLTDALSSDLSNTGAFRVMERGRMDIILKEQGFQQSGACTDAACIVEMGQLLGVDHMVTGSIGKVGQTYSVSLRMINVASGEIVRSLNKYYKGEIDGVLTDVLPAVADELAGKGAVVSAAKAPEQEKAPQVVAASGDVKDNKPQPVIKKKRRKWPWVVLGVVAVGVGSVAIVFNAKNSSNTGTVEVTWPVY